MSGELHYKKDIYTYEIVENDATTKFKVNGRPSNDFVCLLRRLIYKTAYCINCEVCEVDCPTGALSVSPQIKIDKNKCIHCHKCYNSHDRGCIAADCTRMINGTEKKLSAKVQGYKTFGLREEWVEEFFLNTEDFWSDNSLGTAQVDAVKAWLRDAEITDGRGRGGGKTQKRNDKIIGGMIAYIPIRNAIDCNALILRQFLILRQNAMNFCQNSFQYASECKQFWPKFIAF